MKKSSLAKAAVIVMGSLGAFSGPVLADEFKLSSCTLDDARLDAVVTIDPAAVTPGVDAQKVLQDTLDKIAGGFTEAQLRNDEAGAPDNTIDLLWAAETTLGTSFDIEFALGGACKPPVP